jgi:hypothetical protein
MWQTDRVEGTQNFVFQSGKWNMLTWPFRNLSLAVATLLVATVLVATMAFAESPATGLAVATDPKFVLTDPDAKDLDLDLQGEFEGAANYSQFASNHFGLQVVAIGGGRFQGQLLIGGLPGNGWNGVGRIRLIGQREGRVLKLVGGPYEIELQGSARKAQLRFSQGGITLGVLERAERVSPTLGLKPPSQNAILFSGGEADPCLHTMCWTKAKISDDAYLLAGAESIYRYRDFYLHVEFRVPFMPNARGQSRGNSGVYLDSRYEVQILDTFGAAGAADECGALYKFKRPDVNMAFPPLTWQTYDITLRAARFNDKGTKTENAVISVKHNGVVVHDQVELEGPTGAGAEESPDLLPLRLQNHGAPVVYRNIWLAPLETMTEQPATTHFCVRRPKRCR